MTARRSIRLLFAGHTVLKYAVKGIAKIGNRRQRYADATDDTRDRLSVSVHCDCCKCQAAKRTIEAALGENIGGYRFNLGAIQNLENNVSNLNRGHVLSPSIGLDGQTVNESGLVNHAQNSINSASAYDIAYTLNRQRKAE